MLKELSKDLLRLKDSLKRRITDLTYDENIHKYFNNKMSLKETRKDKKETKRLITEINKILKKYEFK